MTATRHRTQNLWAMLRGQTRGILATVSPEGMPHLTNVHYLAHRDVPVIRMTTTSTRVKGRNLLRDDRAVLHVQGDDWFNFAVAEGVCSVAIAKEPGDATDELYALVTEIRGAAERAEIDAEMIANSRMIVRLHVDRVYGQVVAAHPRDRRS